MTYSYSSISYDDALNDEPFESFQIAPNGGFVDFSETSNDYLPTIASEDFLESDFFSNTVPLPGNSNSWNGIRDSQKQSQLLMINSSQIASPPYLDDTPFFLLDGLPKNSPSFFTLSQSDDSDFHRQQHLDDADPLFQSSSCQKDEEDLSQSNTSLSQMTMTMTDRKRRRPITNGVADYRKLASRLQALVALFRSNELVDALHRRPQFITEQEWHRLKMLRAQNALVTFVSFKEDSGALTVELPECLDQLNHALVNDGMERLSSSLNGISAPSRFRWWSDSRFEASGILVQIANRRVKSGTCVQRIIHLPKELAPAMHSWYMYHQEKLRARMANFFECVLKQCVRTDQNLSSNKTDEKLQQQCQSTPFDIPLAFTQTIRDTLYQWMINH